MLLLSTGCGAGWHQPAALLPGPLPARQQVQVWSSGHPRQWHAVAVAADSISGVPYTEPPACEACREGIARAAVDSVRLGNPVAGFWQTFGLVLGAAATLMAITCKGSCHVGN
jgi:hypothetical protein